MGVYLRLAQVYGWVLIAWIYNFTVFLQVLLGTRHSMTSLQWVGIPWAYMLGWLMRFVWILIFLRLLEFDYCRWLRGPLLGDIREIVWKNGIAWVVLWIFRHFAFLLWLLMLFDVLLLLSQPDLLFDLQRVIHWYLQDSLTLTRLTINHLIPGTFFLQTETFLGWCHKYRILIAILTDPLLLYLTLGLFEIGNDISFKKLGGDLRLQKCGVASVWMQILNVWI